MGNQQFAVGCQPWIQYSGGGDLGSGNLGSGPDVSQPELGLSARVAMGHPVVDLGDGGQLLGAVSLIWA